MSFRSNPPEATLVQDNTLPSSCPVINFPSVIRRYIYIYIYRITAVLKLETDFNIGLAVILLIIFVETFKMDGGHRGCDRMAVEFITTYAISAHHH
jgi:hypothetical protein